MMGGDLAMGQREQRVNDRDRADAPSRVPDDRLVRRAQPSARWSRGRQCRQLGGVPRPPPRAPPAHPPPTPLHPVCPMTGLFDAHSRPPDGAVAASAASSAASPATVPVPCATTQSTCPAARPAARWARSMHSDCPAGLAAQTERPLPSEDAPNPASTPSTVSSSATARSRVFSSTTAAASENKVPSASRSKTPSRPRLLSPPSFANAVLYRGVAPEIPPQQAISQSPASSCLAPRSMAYSADEHEVSTTVTGQPPGSRPPMAARTTWLGSSCAGCVPV